MIKNDILLSGYYGFGNAGDEAILQASIQSFQEHNLRVAVLSHTPEETAKKLNAAAYARSSLSATLKGIRESLLVLSGGGGLFQDKTSLKSLIFYLRVPFLAKLLRKKNMIFAQGIGPLLSPAGRLLTSKLCNSFVDRITVRDSGSKELLESIGVKKPIEVTADMAFLFPFPSLQKIKAVRDKFNLSSLRQKQIGVVLRTWEKINPVISQLALVLGEFCAPRNLVPVLIPFQKNRDHATLEELSAKLPIPHVKISETPSPDDLLALISELQMVIGMRFHSLVFSARCNVPFIGLAYDQKVESLSKNLGFPSFNLECFNHDLFLKTLSELWAKQDAARNQLKQTIPHCESEAKRNIHLALELLKQR